mmetsp:Transcript_4481/g.9731  ORF Transcript_4481/g.9731 Transcript_4481/m.9731 type:complete len:231 (-) Transcript_4481:73-765(-)
MWVFSFVGANRFEAELCLYNPVNAEDEATNFFLPIVVFISKSKISLKACAFSSLFKDNHVGTRSSTSLAKKPMTNTKLFMTSGNNESSSLVEEQGIVIAPMNGANNTPLQRKEKYIFMMRSLAFNVESKPLGIIFAEIKTGGIYCLERDMNGSTYAAGIRDGDVIAAFNGNDKILSSILDNEMSMLGESSAPISIKVNRKILEEVEVGKSDNTTAVKMAPRRLPSTKKLV